jgi:chaperonin GroES
MEGFSLAPLWSKVIVKRDAEKQMAAGLHIPDAAKEKPTSGVVVAVGAGHRTSSGEVIPLRVMVGDRVVFGRYGGVILSELATNLKLPDDLVVLAEDEILGVIVEEK